MIGGWPSWLDKVEENAKKVATCLDCWTPEKGFPRFGGEGCKHRSAD